MDSYTLEPGKPLTLKFRVRVTDGGNISYGTPAVFAAGSSLYALDQRHSSQHAANPLRTGFSST